MQIPSLQYLCLRKINEENPLGFKKFVAKYDFIFEDLGKAVEAERKMIDKLIKKINRFPYLCIVYGGAVRDLMNNEVPRNLDVWFFRSEDLDVFLDKFRNIVKVSDEIKGLDLVTKYFDMPFRHLKLIHSKMKNDTPINIVINIILKIKSGSYEPFVYLNDGGLDIDVNLLYIEVENQIISYHPRIKLALSMEEIQKQIYRKEYKVFCRTDCFLDPEVKTEQDCIWKHNKQIKATMKKLNARGWTCINRPCQYKDCIFYNDLN